MPRFPGDSTFSSPPFSLAHPNPQSLITSTTFTLPTTPISPATQTLKRHKSSCRFDREHCPQKGDKEYIPRPLNAFMLFRRECSKVRRHSQADKKPRQADFSKTVSQRWKCLTPEERRYWGDQAAEKAEEHKRLYPHYVYHPRRSVKDKGGRPKNVSFVLPVPTLCTQGGLSAPAPTPYQPTQIPMSARPMFFSAVPWNHNQGTDLVFR